MTIILLNLWSSAGVGRSGTFICIDNVLEQIKKEEVVDIAGAINKMRHQRMKMVQTVVSYGKTECTQSAIVGSYRNNMSSSMTPFWSQ